MNTDLITFNGLGLEFEINRVAFSLFGRDFYWYGIIIAFGFLLAALYGYRRAPKFGIERETLIDQLLFAVPVAIIMTRAYYVIFNFSYYKDDLSKIFRFWDGGLAIYGGIIGAVLTVIIFCKVKKIKIGAMLDIGALGLLIGQCIGRWGNFINKEAFGTVTDLPWRMGIYVSGVFKEVHPTFLYESLWNLLGFVILHFFSKRRRYDGQLFLMYIAWYGLGRGVIEGLRTDSLMLFNTGLRVSQVLGFASFLAAMLIMLYNELFKHHSVTELAVYRMENPDQFEDESGDTVDDAGTGAVEADDVSPDDMESSITEDAIPHDRSAPEDSDPGAGEGSGSAEDAAPSGEPDSEDKTGGEDAATPHAEDREPGAGNDAPVAEN